MMEPEAFWERLEGLRSGQCIVGESRDDLAFGRQDESVTVGVVGWLVSAPGRSGIIGMEVSLLVKAERNWREIGRMGNSLAATWEPPPHHRPVVQLVGQSTVYDAADRAYDLLGVCGDAALQRSLKIRRGSEVLAEISDLPRTSRLFAVAVLRPSGTGGDGPISAE